MAVGPFGPWVERELDDPFDGPELGIGAGSPDGPGEAIGPPATGTALDEFLPIYWVMARSTTLHGRHTPSEVDQLDIAVLAALLGIVPEDPDDPHGSLTGDFATDSARLIARRLAAAQGDGSA